MKELIALVKENGLEGLVAKRKDSVYQPGLRTGLWRKMRVNVGQEFVIGGYTPAAKNFDAMVIGFYVNRGRISDNMPAGSRWSDLHLWEDRDGVGGF